MAGRVTGSGGVDRGHTASTDPLKRVLGHHDAPAKDELSRSDDDAQVDLALSTHGHAVEPGGVVAPYAGSVVPTEQGPGYDVDRDTGA